MAKEVKAKERVVQMTCKAKNLFESGRKSTVGRAIYWTCIVLFFVFFFFSGTIAIAIWGEDHNITQHALDYTFDIRNIGEFFTTATSVGLLIRAAATVFVALLLVKLVRVIVKLLSRGASNRRKTIYAMMYSFFKYGTMVFVLFIILGIFGVPWTALLAGAGVIGIIIGFGAQSLLADIIAGLFIVFEDSFQVGDIITVQDFRGEVQQIGIRTTKIVGVDGNVKVINNSELRTLINMTQFKSFAVSDVTIEYSENLEKVEKLIQDNLGKMKENLPNATAELRYLGPAEFNASGVILRTVAQCDEANRFQLTRDLNRQLKLLFDKHDIKFAVPNLELRSSLPGKKK